MAYGIRVFDASGNVMIDVVDRLTTLHSTYNITVPVNGSVYVPVTGMQNDGTWAALISDLAYYYLTVSLGTGGFLVKFNSMWTSGGSFTTSVVVMRL